MIQLYRYSSTSSTSSTSTRRCSCPDTATGSSPRTHYTKVLWAEKKSEKQNKNGTSQVKLENLKHTLIQTHELGDSYDKGATHSVIDYLIDDEQQQ